MIICTEFGGNMQEKKTINSKIQSRSTFEKSNL